MGAWTLKEHGVDYFVSTNQSESLHAAIKRLTNLKNLRLPKLAEALLQIMVFYEKRKSRAEHGSCDYTLQSHISLKKWKPAENIPSAEKLEDAAAHEQLVS